MSTREEYVIHPAERALVEAFVRPGRRDRLLRLLHSPRGRAKLVGQLAHFHDLDPRYAHRIPPRDQHVAAILGALPERGAPDTCHVMGASELDGQEVELRRALEELVDTSFGNFLSCIPGKLGYFGGEEANERYILERTGDDRTKA